MWIMMYLSYFLMVTSFISLVIWGVIEYLSVNFLSMNHIQFSLIASILYMFTQTLIMFYFIATGKNIKEFIINNKLDINNYKKVLSMKMKLFPHIMVNMVILGTVFIIGGAIFSNIISEWQYAVLFFICIFHYTYLLIIQHDCFKVNTELVIKLYKLSK